MKFHVYIGRDLQGRKIFNIEVAKEFYGEYRQLWVVEINDYNTIEFAEKQVKSLENNRASIKNLINDISEIKFVFELDRHYFSISGEFSNIEWGLEKLQERK